MGFTLGSPIGMIRGYPAFKSASSLTPGGPIFTWSVIVSEPGKFPFRYISRREMLDHMTQVNESQRAKAFAIVEQVNPIRPAAVQVAEKIKDLAKYIKDAKDERQRQNLTERFLRDYRTDEQKIEGEKRRIGTSHDKIAARLDAVRARYTPDALLEPAAIEGEASKIPFEGFDFVLTKKERCNLPVCDLEGDHHGWLIGEVLRLPADPGLLPTSPRFFTVSVQWGALKRNPDTRDEPFERLRDAFFARFDFDMAAMLAQ